MNIYEVEGEKVIKLSDIPEEHKEEFFKFMKGGTIPATNIPTVYLYDWEKYLNLIQVRNQKNNVGKL